MPLPRLLVAGIGSLLLGACANMPPRSVQDLPPVEHKALEKTGTAIADESAKLLQAQDRRLESIERKAPLGTVTTPLAPAYDPLEHSVVSISMFDADVGQLLWALAGELKMNLIVDPKVLEQKQRSSLHLSNVSAREVFNHILEAFDLHGELRGGALVVSQTKERIFNVDMLNSVTSLDLATGGDVFGAGMAGEGGGQSLRGALSMIGTVGKESDPYKQLGAALDVILEIEKAKQNTAPTTPDAPKPAAVASYNLDPNSGTLFVRGRPSQIRAVEELVEHNKKKLRRQVLVEAQILDVSLNDNSNFGVDWNLLRDRVAGIYADTPATILPAADSVLGYDGLTRLNEQARTITFPNQTLGSALGRAMGLSYMGDTFSAAVNVLRGFGNVKVLSNPSVRVRNGSPAYLSVGTNIRYVTKSTSNFSNTGGGASNQSTDIQTDSLFSGVVIGVAPMIHDNGTVELLVHPMQTEVDTASLALKEFPNGNAVTLPQVNVKGITTTLNLRDGDTVMLGGLIDQNASLDDRGVPGLSDVPVFGRMFGSRAKRHTTRELVLVLRVKVL
ncbi:type II secretion system protein [Stenotrophomonas pictorum JCM 9942]|uniref:Type II secretion system protein n=2 Tax=Stenotrophomonas pictorum TaxID=86184 RepID=A0A0R0AUY5_9GAMM|nr:type II secretion system protein [Stenotrophomonas pictorum JCM 9942]